MVDLPLQSGQWFAKIASKQAGRFGYGPTVQVVDINQHFSLRENK